MARLDFVSAVNDPRNTHNFSNPEYAIDDSLSSYASASSFATGAAVFRALIFDIGEVADVRSLTVVHNFCGGGAWSLNVVQHSTDATNWTSSAYTLSEVIPGTWRATFDATVEDTRYIALGWSDPNGGYQCWAQIKDVYADADVTPTPPPEPDPPPVTFTVNEVEFERVTNKQIRVELNNVGSFSFAINKSDPQATEANLARGNVVRVTFPQIHPDAIFEGLIEEGDFD